MPAVLSFNEVCFGVQHLYLYDVLRNARGYTASSYYYPKAVADELGQYCDNIGNLVMARLPELDDDRRKFQMDDGQERNWVCLKGQGYVDGWYCSTHMAVTVGPNRSNLNEFRAILQISGALVGAGDFNARPDTNEVIQYPNNGYQEGSGFPLSHSPTFKSKMTGSEIRLDYIFLNDYIFDVHLPERIIGPQTYSDHYAYEAWIGDG